MKTYADYKFYCEEYGGKMNENDFACSIIHASQYIRQITFGRSDFYKGDEMKYAACEIADIHYKSSSMVGMNIKSESNDGYSISRVVEGMDGETIEELIRRKSYSSARKWLNSTGLLTRRVRCSHAN